MAAPPAVRPAFYLKTVTALRPVTARRSEQPENIPPDATLGSIAAEIYCERLRRYLTSRGGRHDAEDLAQEVYLRLVRTPLSNLIVNPEAYIIAVARHVVIELFQYDKRNPARHIDSDRLQQEPPCSSDEPDHWVSSSQFLERFLSDLPPEQAAALLLYECDGLSYVQVAERLKVSERAVQRYLTKAREKLRHTLTA
jgi:RNA polymerase sigma factor (sigma-70 family)